jgi:hypothetical protein
MDPASEPRNLRPAADPIATSTRQAGADLTEIERDVKAGRVDTYTALALAFVAGVEHARRLLSM